MTPNTSLRPPHVLVPMHTYVPTYMYTRPVHENGKPIIFVLVCMCVSKQVLRPKCGDQRTTSGTNSLLLPHGPSGTNLGSQTWRQEPLPTRSSPHPFKCKTYTRRKVSNCRTLHNCWWRCYFALLLKKRTIKSSERVLPHPCKPTLQPYRKMRRHSSQKLPLSLLLSSAGMPAESGYNGSTHTYTWLSILLSCNEEHGESSTSWFGL